MEQSDQSKVISVRPLGGLNQRVSPIDLSPSDFAEVKGLFPNQVGILERIWGSKFLTKFDEPVLSISPTYNSVGSILIQTSTKRYTTTLDELFDRNEYTPDLTPTTSVPGEEIDEEETMAMAIIVGKKSAGTAGKTITSSAFTNSANRRDLSDIALNEGGIIVGAIASDTIDISAGTYRIEFWACCCGNITGTTPIQYQTKMWNETDNLDLYEVGGNVSVASSNFDVSLPARAIDTSENHVMHHIGQVTLDATTNISIRSRSGTANATVLEGKPANLGEDEVYTVIKILKVA